MKFNEQESCTNTNAVINDLLEDGSDPDALYIIEHHVSSNEFELLEKLAIEAFQLGFEMSDPEEIEDEANGKSLFGFDIISELPLDEELINIQIKKIVTLCEKFNVSYDGWGTYFEDQEGDDEQEKESETDNNESDAR